MTSLNILKKVLKTFNHGGFFAKIREYTINPIPDSLKNRAERIEQKKGYFNPKLIGLAEILNAITDTKTLVEIISNKRIGLSHNLLLTKSSGKVKMFQITYPHKINADPLTEFNGAIVFHTTSRRDNIADIAFENMVLRGWSAIGYHFVILQDGTIINTRPITIRGDHTYGFNDSIGIAFAKNLTRVSLNEEEIRSAELLVGFLRNKFRITRIYGHRTAQLEAIKNLLKKISAENRGLNFRIKPFIAKISELQEIIHSGNPVSLGEIKLNLMNLMNFLKTAPLKVRRRMFIGSIPLSNYIKGIKKCPGKYFKFKLFSLR